jgi:hypothetical protein
LAPTRHITSIGRRIVQEWRRRPILLALVVPVLLAGVASVAAGTLRGLTYFRDVGYPDSATLLRIGDLVRSGHVYPPIDLPPYLVTLYGPFTYLLLGIPFSLARFAGVRPELAVRFAIFGALCLCVLWVFLLSRRLHRSRTVAALCILFALSVSPMARWTTQIRGDFLALAFSLASIYAVLRGNARRQVLSGAIVAGIAVLVKQTSVAAPIAITIWLLYRRRHKDAIYFVIGFAAVVAGGYSFELWREPLMLKHIAAIRHPVLEFREASSILWRALSQPAVPFAVVGGLFFLESAEAERMLFLTYSMIAWIVAIVTIPQAGGNINYFWEPLFASAVLAGSGLFELQRKARQTPIVVAALVLVLLVSCLLPILREDIGYVRICYGEALEYRMLKAKWQSFVAIVSGRRLLSTLPDVTVHASTPEIPDPILNSVLERRGVWNSRPVADRIDGSVYELIVISTEEGSGGVGYRGIRSWSDAMWNAMKRRYRPACEFQGMEVWLPFHSSGATAILPKLLSAGCLPMASDARIRSERDSQFPESNTTAH